MEPQKNPVCVSSPESENGKVSKKERKAINENLLFLTMHTKLRAPSCALVTEKSVVGCYSLVKNFLVNEVKRFS